MTAKTCQICGQDCSTRPRVRDGDGRYACRACLEQRSSSAPQRPSRPRPAPAPAADDEAALLAEFAQQARSMAPTPCPGCSHPLDPGAVVCLRCGFRLDSNEQIKTRVLKAPKERKSKKSAARGETAELRDIAHAQRRVLNAILITFLTYFAMIIAIGITGPAGAATAASATSAAQPAAGANPYVVGAFGIVLLAESIIFVLRVLTLAGALGWSQASRVILAVLMFMSCLSLIALLAVNSAATRRLKRGGIRVGLLGAKL